MSLSGLRMRQVEPRISHDLPGLDPYLSPGTDRVDIWSFGSIYLRPQLLSVEGKHGRLQHANRPEGPADWLQTPSTWDVVLQKLAVRTCRIALM